MHEQSEPYSFSCSPGGVQQAKRKQRRKVSSQRQAGLLGCSVFGLFHCIQTRITIQLIEANNEKQIHIDPKWGHTDFRHYNPQKHPRMASELLLLFFLCVVILGLGPTIP